MVSTPFSRRQFMVGAGLAGLLLLRPMRLLAAQPEGCRPFVIAVGGTELDSQQFNAIANMRPAGFMLYGNNIDNREQLSALTASLRKAAGKDALIFTDQEGGAVSRLRPPHWLRSPGASDLGMIASKNEEHGRRATYLSYRLIAHDLAEMGINVNAAPVIDLQYASSLRISNQRSFSTHSQQAAMLARIACMATLEGGVLPVLKHIPGQGRAERNTDNHVTHITASGEELKQDWSAFQPLGDMPLAMVSHAFFDAIDAKNPAALSPKMIRFIREKIGFKGLLVTDDLLMKAMADNDHVANMHAARASGNSLLHYSQTAGNLETIIDGSHWPQPDAGLLNTIRGALRLPQTTFKPCDPQALRIELRDIIKQYAGK